MTQRLPFISRGFVGKRRAPDAAKANRVPPGQYVTNDFPVLSAGPTPRVNFDRWSFTIDGLVREPVRWTWDEFRKLPAQDFVVDISCVTKWTHLDMRWRGVSIDTLLEHVEIDPKARFVIEYTFDDYTANVPLHEVINGQAFVAYEYDGQPLAPEHGGPARVVVPHLYFWKSAKWARGLRLVEHDKPGFWETRGYNNHGNPWKEQRYAGDSTD